MFLSPEFIWCIIGIIMLLIELSSPGFVFIFFSIGAFVTAICSYSFRIGINSQIILFLIVSILFLIVLRKYFSGVFKGFLNKKEKMKSNMEIYVGEKCVVTEEILSERGGKVEFHGTDWKAVSNEVIAKGSLVKIIKQDNLTFTVVPNIEKGEK